MSGAPAAKASVGGKKKETFADRRRFAKDTVAGENVGVDKEFILPRPDVNRVPGQNWYVLTYCAPEGSPVRCRDIAVKVSGCCNTPEEANKIAEIIRNEDDRFDVWVVGMYNWIKVPIPDEVKSSMQVEYPDKMLTRIMRGQQKATTQQRKEMEERMARDRAKAEAAMRKKMGADYKMPEKAEVVKQYEHENLEREERAETMNFSQRDLIEGFAKFISSAPGAMDPRAAGEFLRFMEAKKMATKQLEEHPELDNVGVVLPEQDEAPKADFVV